MATKYSRGKIYRLVNDIDSDIYIGSTCETLAKRKGKHKREARTNTERRVYKHLNQVGWDNVHIILIEEYPCQNIEQLKARERHWIEKINPTLNTYIPLRTRKEWYEENKEEVLNKRKEYCENKADVVKQSKKTHYEKNKDVILKKCKDWREKNRDYDLSKKRERYALNKEKIHEQRSIIIKCECGGECSKSHIARHKKSKQHQEWLSNQASTSS